MSTEYTLRIPDDLAILIRKMHPQLKRKIQAALTDIIHDPNCGKQLKLELAGLWTYGIGRFRITYRFGADKIIELVALGPRKIIYEETYRLLVQSKR